MEFSASLRWFSNVWWISDERYVDCLVETASIALAPEDQRRTGWLMYLGGKLILTAETDLKLYTQEGYILVGRVLYLDVKLE